MYEIFAELLDQSGKKTIDVARATGIPSSTFTDWKKGRSTPKQDKLKKIADFFQCIRGLYNDRRRTGRRNFQ